MLKYPRWFWREQYAVRILLAISAILFFASLFCNAYTEQTFEGVKSMPAILALLTGWGDMPSPSFAWFANPIGFVGWLLIWQRQYKSALYICILAVLLAISFLLESHVLIDEAGNTGAILSRGLGYWLWLASTTSMLIASWVAFAKKSIGQVNPSINNSLSGLE